MELCAAYLLLGMPKSFQNHMLYPHQIDGIAWLRYMEENAEQFKTSGGVLADEMGLGKTIQMISLVLQRKTQVPRTLLVVPSSALHQWVIEINRVAGKALRVVICKGPIYQQKQLDDANIVIVSFNRLVLDFKSTHILNDIQWDRVVVDEAHNFCSVLARRTLVLQSLRSKYRWCVTGTPILNRASDLDMLLTFLRVEPYCHWLCSSRGCNCIAERSIDLIEAFCRKCGCRSRSHVGGVQACLQRRLSYPMLQTFDHPAIRVPSFILRRDSSLLNLPKLDINITNVLLTPLERDIYDYILQAAKFGVGKKNLTSRNRYELMIVYLTLLRQVLDTPELILFDEQHFKAMRQSTSIPTVGYCSICCDEVSPDSNLVLPLICGHMVHATCFTTSTICPSCMEPIQLQERRSRRISHLQLNRKDPTEFIEASEFNTMKAKVKTEFGNKIGNNFKSTKTNLLLKMVSDDVAKGKKVLVFSQFSRFLHLIGFHFKNIGIKFGEVTGRIKNDVRLSTMAQFHRDPTLQVLLISLRSGGEALNLQPATRIYLMDPWWNESAELQAIKRAHRIGQRDDVVASRFICENTLEPRILQLQRRKKTLADNLAFGKKQSASLDDMNFVLQLI